MQALIEFELTSTSTVILIVVVTVIIIVAIVGYRYLKGQPLSNLSRMKADS